MKFAKNFTRPEVEPVVPERLAERITQLLPHATKIDVMEMVRGGWRVVNTLYLEGGEDASEVYTLVKALISPAVEPQDTQESRKTHSMMLMCPSTKKNQPPSMVVWSQNTTPKNSTDNIK